MQAPIIQESSIDIHFGGQIPKGHSQLNLSFVLDFFSAEQQAIRKQYESNLKITLPGSSLVLELVVGGNSAEVAEKLNNSPLVKQANQNGSSVVNYYSYGNKVIIIASGTGEEISSFFQTQEENFAHLKGQLDQSHKIYLDIASKNNLGQISQLVKQRQSLSYGFLDSLQLHFGFEKSPASEKIIGTILEKIIGFQQGLSIFKSFKKVNIQLNCSSARCLEEFPNIQLRAIHTKPTNELVGIFQQAKIQAAHIYVLNPTLFLKGNFDLAGLSEFIPILFD